MGNFSVGSDQWIEFIIQNAGTMGIAVHREMAEKLAAHAAELILWNKKVNLTAITDPMDIAVKHVLDSMAAVPLIPDDACVLDIGSGGGFPGIVLKVVKPGLSVVLVDASRKKVSFLQHVIRLLSLPQIEAIHTRAEDLKQSGDFTRKFDVVTCRAFSSLETFVSMSRPFVKDEGLVIAYKGKDAENEIQDVSFASEKIKNENMEKRESFTIKVQSYLLPHPNIERCLIILRKKSQP